MPARATTETLRRRRPRIVVAGLGNLLLMDDGVGVHAVRELQRKRVRGAAAVEVGTALLDALHLFERADHLLAIDAMQAGGEPGTIYRFDLDDLERPRSCVSLHELSLTGALELIPHQPPRIAILGVEPAKIRWGLELSPEVRAVLPRLVEEAAGTVAAWAAE